MSNYYVGLDLHCNNTHIGIIDEEGSQRFYKKIPNSMDQILLCLDSYKDGITGVVFESTFNWYWLADGLIQSGYTVHMAHPVAMKPYAGIKFTDDKHDAFWLANLLRLGILPTGFIHNPKDRQLRDLLRKRLMLVQQRTQHILSFKSLMNRNLCKFISSNQIKKMKESDVDDLIDQGFLNLSAKANIASLNFLTNRINIIEKSILAIAKKKEEYNRLLTVPGIGKSLALTILLETGDISRFKRVGDYASYCRCVPSKRLSNNKQKGENNRKNGNKYLAWAFVEAANFSKRYSPQAAKFYAKKIKKTHRVVAIKALAHKLARACYYIMKDNVRFNPEKLFNCPDKNGCSSKPDRGLAPKPKAPIELTAAATQQ